MGDCPHKTTLMRWCGHSGMHNLQICMPPLQKSIPLCPVGGTHGGQFSAVLQFSTPTPAAVGVSMLRRLCLVFFCLDSPFNSEYFDQICT